MENEVPEREPEGGDEEAVPAAASGSKQVDFNDECVARVGERFGRVLVKQSRVTWKSPDNSLGLICKTSRRYVRGHRSVYWFAVHSTRYGRLLSSVGENWVAFGCSSSEAIVLVPYVTFLDWAAGLNITTMKNGEVYWHVHIWEDASRFELRRKTGFEAIDLMPFLLPTP